MSLDPTVATHVPRPDAGVIDALSKLSVATLHEVYGRRGLMHGITGITPGAKMCGPAVTSLNHAGDNLMLHVALEQCRRGDVLVVATTAPSEHGMFGELLATSCQALGIAGVVIDAAARDTETIREKKFPIWTRHVSASGTTKAGFGWVNIPVSCGGVVVNPGDILIGDDDGVVVIEADVAAQVADLGRQRVTDEEALDREFADGVLSLDAGGGRLRKVIEAGNLKYRD
jgi:4-hydroxy-4-methyl-2-oxoglutarate aldolase